ncbi:MAG: response regulator [Planctomycetaceae bacterium]|nr:response regulator [Planctomycetaceae bacterium]
MTPLSSGSTDSVLEEIRSTIASFESLRSAASARRNEQPGSSSGASASQLLAKITAPKKVEEKSAAQPAAAQAVRKTVAPPVRSVFSEMPTIPTTIRKATLHESAASSSLTEEETKPDRQDAQVNINAEQDATDPIVKAPAEHSSKEPARAADKEAVEKGQEETPKPIITPNVSLRAVDKTAKIMIVDDEPLNLMTFRQHLKMEGYENFITTSDPREAMRLLRTEQPDVMLLDIRMPEISGLDILRVIGLDPILQHIPVLILTAATDPETRKQALDLGASDFLQKPIDPNELLPRVRNAIVIKKHYDMAASEAARLELQVERRTRQLEATRQQLILCLARAAEHRDNDTGNHVIRVGRYTSIIAKQMGYAEHKLEMLEQAAQLHDVGKIGIPDSILFKPGKLHQDEYNLMKRHCALGKQIIEPISEKEWSILKTHTRIGESMLHVRSSSLLMLAARIAQTHHEHWNGNGYPLGLKGEDIPLEGRIVAVADVFDALSSRRPYKEPFPRQKCFDILAEGRGNQFDPAVLDAFFACAEEIVEVQLLLMDEEDRIPKSEWESVAANSLKEA